MQGARDLCVEYLAARVWPLKKGQSFVCFHKKTIRGKDYLYPDSEVVRPKNFLTDEEFVSAVEVKAVAFLEFFQEGQRFDGKDIGDRL